jgi:4-aminobutyrate aminotransferase/(S)-3-amino-2-methylpropionate transaminase
MNKNTQLWKLREQHVPKALWTLAHMFTREARGATIIDMSGKTYIDFAGGIGSANVGHGNPAVVKAVVEQARRFMHVGQNVILYEPYVALAQVLNRIVPIAGKKQTMFFTSGAEAVENAVKVARYATKRPGIVCLENGFSGRTLLTMTLTSKVKPYKFGFGPFAPEVYQVHSPYPYRKPAHLSEKEYVDWCIGEFEEFLTRGAAPEKIAAVVLELVQGEGGLIVLPKQYVRAVAALCKKNGILLVVDEIQTGLGRTGRMFATEHYGIKPDLVTLAKSLGGGLPLSAITGRAELMDVVHENGLGGTFGGNPVACAAGLAAIKEIQRLKLVQRAERLGKVTRKRFIELQEETRIVGDVRGLGAMHALELVTNTKTKEPAKELTKQIAQQCVKDGLLMLSAGTHSNVLRTLMPLAITDAELAKGLTILSNAVKRAA